MNSQPSNPKSGERIAKVIARAGLASRREAEEWIAAGRVAVNGAVICSPALNVTDRDRISVDGEPLPARERTRLFLYHKPRGLMTTHADPQGRPTIFQRLPRDLPRLISVGRLDFNTEGLLLLTNDGALARVLELPATGWLRRYRVRAHGSVTQARLDELRNGVTISGMHYGSIEASLDRVQGSNVWLSLAIREGKNREVRNVLSHLGLTVTRLIRVSFGPFQLGELAEGAVEEVRTRVLREQLGEKLVRLSGADFSAPRAPPRPSPERNDAQRTALAKPASGKRKNRNSSAHAWRAHEEGRPAKKLRRIFRGSRRDMPERHPPAGEARSEVLTDRQGRPVAVERYGRRAQSSSKRPRRRQPRGKR
jgi:23S rRNA pseudouridine2605 synthase